MPEVSNHGVRISYDVAGEGRPLVLLHGWCCDRSWWTEPGYVERTQERSPPRQRRHPRPRRERQAARSRRLHLGCPDRRRVRGRRRRRPGSVRDLGAVLRRMDRVDDRGRRPGAGPGDRGLGIVGPATPARRADGDRRVGRGPQARRDERAGRPVQDRRWSRVRPRVPTLGAGRHPASRSRGAARLPAPELWAEGSRTRTSGRSPSRRCSSPGSWRTRTTTPRRWPR